MTKALHFNVSFLKVLLLFCAFLRQLCAAAQIVPIVHGKDNPLPKLSEFPIPLRKRYPEL
jgi:hypothetical protein